MIAPLTANRNQSLCPIPAIGQNVELARDGKFKIFDHFLCNRYFGMEATASPGRLAMIESGPKGQKKLLVKQGGKYPLMAKDVSHILSMISVPAASRNLFSTLLSNGVIDDKKRPGAGIDIIENILKSFWGQTLLLSFCPTSHPQFGAAVLRSCSAAVVKCCGVKRRFLSGNGVDWL